MFQRGLRLFSVVVLLAGLGVAAWAQDVRYFRIATGSIGGTYFPIGSIIASAISNPPGSRTCEDGGSCGVPGLIAVAQTTDGSLQNVEMISAGRVESGFSQADVAFWAFYGRQMFRQSGRREELRAIAGLYPESIHVVVRKYGGISGIADMKGRRVSLGAPGSGTALDAQLILQAHGLSAADMVALYLSPGPSADLMRENKLDAFFSVGGAPLPAIADLAENLEILLLPIAGAPAERLRSELPFFVASAIPDGTYKHVPVVDTLSVTAQWVVSRDVPEDLVYAITEALWHDSTRKLLDKGHPDGRLIRRETALDGIAIPLHKGAERFYREHGDGR